MAASKSSPEQVPKAPKSGDESEDDSEILEESPCGRWLKRREEVQQRDIPGIDAAYLAMDTEEGVEVVWNEVKFSERKNFKAQEEKIRQVFDSLTQLEHPNIVKFHKYWMDKDEEKPRVIFITEYMSSGSLKQFLKKTKRNVIKLPLQAWKRWCTQVLSALSYLHSCSPPIIHGNLTCDTIFIQHNGLIKIGSGNINKHLTIASYFGCSYIQISSKASCFLILSGNRGTNNVLLAPDAIHRHVKTCRDNIMNVHCIAPEFGFKSVTMVTPAVDIYSFGMCALEMAALEISGNGDTGSQITEEIIRKTIESLENPLQKDFIKRCLNKNPSDRPTARELLFHPVIFEVHSLRLLAAHVIVVSASYQPDQLTDEAFRSKYNVGDVLAETSHKDGHKGSVIQRSDAQKLELEKFLEDVRNGIYPLTAFAPTHPPIVRPRAVSPEISESVKSTTPEPADIETRHIINMMCTIKPQEEGQAPVMTILLRMDDKMNRQLSCELTQKDNANLLAEELVFHGFINQRDRDMVASVIKDTITRNQPKSSCVPIYASPLQAAA